MTEFFDSVGPFCYGFAVGYFWYPLWELGKKIVSEAKKAREEW